MLAAFSVKEKEARMSDTKSSSSLPSQTCKDKKEKPCFFSELPGDAVRKVISVLPAQQIFLCIQAARLFCAAQDDLGFWTCLLRSEFDSAVVPGVETDVISLKRTYRERARLWSTAVETYEWLMRIGYPCDVSGTRNGIPLRQTVLDGLSATLTLAGPGLPKPRRHHLRAIALPCLGSLIQSASSAVRERATSALASLARQGQHGAPFLVRRGLQRPLRDMLFDNCLGHQKQAARLLVNALIHPSRRVLRPCFHAELRSPRRGAAPTDGGGGDAGVEWVCVEFSPSGQAGEPHTVRMWVTAAGRLCCG